MKIKILGNGFIASHLNYDIIKERVIPEKQKIRDLFNTYKPDTIINCIGFCGSPNIDQCEVERFKTIESNLTIPTLLAEVSKEMGIHMLTLASGCIYYGKSPNIINEKDTGWKESDFALPQSFYSKTKYACDLMIGNIENVCTLRIRMPISRKNSPRNLINKLLNYKNVLVKENSVTFVDDLVNVVDWVIKNKKTGIYHVTNPQPLTHKEILDEYKKYYPDHEYNVIDENELTNFVKSPRSNCVLSTEKINKYGFYLMDSKIALEHCMRDYVGNKGKNL